MSAGQASGICSTPGPVGEKQGVHGGREGTRAWLSAGDEYSGIRQKFEHVG